MSLRKIQSFTKATRVATVYRDSEWNEYRVTFRFTDCSASDGTYHCDDKAEALHVAEMWAEGKIG